MAAQPSLTSGWSTSPSPADGCPALGAPLSVVFVMCCTAWRAVAKLGVPQSARPG